MKMKWKQSGTWYQAVLGIAFAFSNHLFTHITYNLKKIYIYWHKQKKWKNYFYKDNYLYSRI